MFYPSFVLIDLAVALKSSKISKYATVRGNGSDNFSTIGRPTVNKSYLRQKIPLRARLDPNKAATPLVAPPEAQSAREARSRAPLLSLPPPLLLPNCSPSRQVKAGG